MRIIKVTLNAILILVISSCATTQFEPEEVSSIDVKLIRFLNDNIVAVDPGKKYKVGIEVKKMNGETIKNPDLSQFTVQSLNNSFKTLKQNPRRIDVVAIKDTFAMAHKERYLLEVGLLTREDIKAELILTINWEKLNTLNNYGTDGNDGSDGDDGASGGDSDRYSIDGEDGSDGADGDNATNGKDVEIAVGYYDVSDLNIPGVGDKMLLIYNSLENEIQLTKIQQITVKTYGGKGGNGGNGGEGGNGGRFTPEKDEDAIFSPRPIDGRDGSDGSGGRGGDGGNGGDLTLYYFDESVGNLINPNISGGAGGTGGDGDGVAFKGQDGRSGKYKKVMLSKEEFINLIRSSNNQNIEVNRLTIGEFTQ